MKVLYVTDVFPPHCGGSGWSVYFFARALRSSGIPVDVISLDGPSRTYDGFQVTGYSLPQPKVPFLDTWKRENFALPSITRHLRKLQEHYSLVHAHHRLSTVAVATAEPERLFVTVRDYWPICMCGRSLYRTGPSCNLFDFTRCTGSVLAPLVYPWLAITTEKRRTQLQKAEKVFCISNYLRDQLLPYISADKLVVLPNFAEEVQGPYAGELPPEFMLYIGRLEKNKGADLLPEILRKVRTNVPLVIVGEGSLQKSLKKELSGRAHFLGYVEYPLMLSILEKANCILFPSVWPEPLGRVLIEASMMSRPSIAFAHPGGHRDVVENNVNGILVETIDEFAAAIDRLQRDGDLRKSLGMGGRKIYEEKFSPGAVMEKLLSEYKEDQTAGLKSLPAV